MIKPTLDILRKYKFKSVFFRYFRMLLTVMLIFFLVYTVILSAYYHYSQNRDLKFLSREISMKSGNYVDHVMGEVLGIYESAASSEYINLLLSKEGIPVSSSEYQSTLHPVVYTFFSQVNKSDWIANVYLCSFKSQYVYSNTVSGKMEVFEDRDWLKRYRQTGETFYMMSSLEPMTGKEEYLSVCWKLDNIGFLCVQVELDRIEDELLRMNQQYQADFYILDQNQEMLYTVSSGQRETDEEEAKRIIAGFCPEADTDEIQKNGFLYALTRSEYDLSYVTVIPEKQLMDTKGIGTVIVLGAAGLLIALVILAFYVTEKIYQSIVEIIALFHVQGSEASGPDQDNWNETLFISNNIMRIIKDYSAVEQQLTRELKSLQQARKVALQTQINPHFIFNTLQAVNLFVMNHMGKDNEAVRIITLLSEFLRITLNTKDHIVPISLEVEYARKYMEIQNIKYENMFHVVWEVDPQTENLKTVKMILQPILENAVNHAFDYNSQNCRIHVRIRKMGDDVVITVTDNGLGIEGVVLERLRQQMQQDEIAENQHIGLLNVHLRIRLTFGEKYGVQIFSKPGKGTKVQMRMPAIAMISKKGS